MISYLKGKILFTDETSVTILTSSIGWNVNVPNSLDFNLGEEYEIYIYTHQTEKAMSLWGFKTLDELNFFKLLLEVNGVGPKTASLLLAEKTIEVVSLAISNSDFKALKVKGLGDKVAQKIILELKDKIPEQYMSLGGESSSESLNSSIEALKALGYSLGDIMKAIDKVGKNNLITLNESDIIKILLRNI